MAKGACLTKCEKCGETDFNFNEKKLNTDYEDYDFTDFHKNLYKMKEFQVEIKSVDAIAPIHETKLLTYLKLSNIWVGLLINFITFVKKNIKWKQSF